MATIKKYNGSSWENAVVRKYGTASEIITPPTTIYADGTAISTYSIKGNTAQSGTPTPSNPITISGVGNKTANLFDINGTWTDFDCSHTISGNDVTVSGLRFSYIAFTAEANTKYALSHKTVANQRIAIYAGSLSGSALALSTSGFVTFTTSSETQLYILFYASDGTTTNTVTYSEIMLVKGDYTAQTMPTFEPYGQYKIPISKDSQPLPPIYVSQQLFKIGDTTDDYSSSGTATYNMGKLILTGNETWSRTSAGKMYSSNAFDDVPNYNHALAITTMCTHYTCIENAANTGTLNVNQMCLYGHATAINTKEIYIYPENYATAADFATYLQQQYANGTPVTVWYILATPTTETVTAPPIPTTEGANSITVDTTVQPSEFTATWTGWHNAEVKEKSENLCDYSTFADNYYLDITTGLPKEYSSTPNRIATLTPCDVTNINTVTLSYTSSLSGDTKFIYSLFNGNTLVRRVADNDEGAVIDVSDGDKLYLSLYNVSYTVTVNTISSLMLNEGSTALPYEPYWK